MTPEPPARARLLPLAFYYFAFFAALGVYAPFFPRWLEARGVTGLRMGAVAALIPAMGVVGPPVFGLAADALGLRRQILRLASAGAAISLGLVAAAGAAGRGLSYAELFAAVLVFAVFRSPMIMMADVVTMGRARAAATTYRKLSASGGRWGFLLVGARRGPMAGSRRARGDPGRRRGGNSCSRSPPPGRCRRAPSCRGSRSRARRGR